LRGAVEETGGAGMAGLSTQQSLRKALGAIKDSTKVGLAKVNSSYKASFCV
jgi:hypothetical protein